MSKKFITVDKDNKVQLTHYMPFDPVEGFGKSEAELLSMGFLVDDVPQPLEKAGQMAVLYYTQEKGFWYEYIATPQSQNMTLVQSVQEGVISEEQFQQITGVPYRG